MDGPEEIQESAWILRVPVRTPTLPPATHSNVYIVGDGDVAVVDPASPWPDGRAALDDELDRLRSRGYRVVEILLTHHHVDHVSGAVWLAERLSVPIAAHRITAELLSQRVPIARTLDEGDVLRYGAATLDVLHTPGHAPGHLVFVERASRAIIAGDMVASVGTIIIDPPEGDMRLYLASLERLRRLGARCLLPAHGPPVRDPERLLSFYIAHRLERERRVVAALELGPAVAAALVPRAYPEIAPAIYPLAERSLLAHLLKLRDDGRAVEREGTWHLA